MAFRQRQDGTRLIAAGDGAGTRVAPFTTPESFGAAGSFDAFAPDFLGGVDVG